MALFINIVPFGMFTSVYRLLEDHAWTFSIKWDINCYISKNNKYQIIKSKVSKFALLVSHWGRWNSIVLLFEICKQR